MSTLWGLCPLGSLLLTNANKGFGSSHLGNMTPWPASMEDIPFQACSQALGPAKYCACFQTAAAEQLSFSLAYNYLVALISFFGGKTLHPQI